MVGIPPHPIHGVQIGSRFLSGVAVRKTLRVAQRMGLLVKMNATPVLVRRHRGPLYAPNVLRAADNLKNTWFVLKTSKTPFLESAITLFEIRKANLDPARFAVVLRRSQIEWIVGRPGNIPGGALPSSAYLLDQRRARPYRKPLRRLWSGKIAWAGARTWHLPLPALIFLRLSGQETIGLLHHVVFQPRAGAHGHDPT